MRITMIKIGNVKLKLDYYTGKDVYSDGEIEDEILEIVKTQNDFTEILATDNRWPILYHLSPSRRNLLEWYHFDKNKTLLEIGAGCGALTGLFAEKCSSVTAIELSKRRAEIIAHRNKEQSNLEIIVANVNDVKFKNKFDYITLIGVFEYAGKYMESLTPYEDFLALVKNMLKEDGVLIIAIENKLGLKYWGGCREDHTGKLFDGIEGYVSDNMIKTFSKFELENLLQKAGFKHQNYYYPIPDYKIPTNIFSDQHLPKAGLTDNIFINYDMNRLSLFNEKLAFNNIVDNFDVFSNSFLVFAEMR